MPSLKPLALVLALLPTCLSAQQASVDTTGFHAGQWGVQLGASGSGLVNLGILRFSSPRSAWMLLVEFSGEFLSGTRTDVGVSEDQDDRSVSVAAGVGRRFYQAPRHKVRSFQSIGVFGSYDDFKQDFPGGTFRSKNWRAGLLGELGAGYWVTPHLSLGGTASIAAGRSNRRQESGTASIDESGWFVSGLNVALVVGLYF
jgi:hypothetical protein